MIKFVTCILLSTIYTYSNDIQVDENTKLSWQNNSAVENTKLIFDNAKEYCENLVLNSYDDWRLPSIKELQTIVNTKTFKPAVHDGFDYTQSTYYWSSTLRLNDPYNGWLINFEYGYTDYSSTSGKNFVRCVRKTN